MTDTELTVLKDIQVPAHHLCGLTCIGRLVWFSDAALERIFCLNTISGTIVRSVPCPKVRTGLTNADGLLWQVAGPNRDICGIDPDTGELKVRQPLKTDNELCGIEAAGENVWFGYRGPGAIELRRRSTFELIQKIPVDAPVAGLTFTGTFVAFAVYEASCIHILDPRDGNTVDKLHVPGQPTGLGFDGARFWYCDYRNVRVRAVEAPSSVVAR